ncbi:hypothetical protein [Nonomuraea endophytica]|uniref:Band 7 domain-containing protein n=1 Tax=Nonomuraea endophytica TaxID=714136 RepID=A0A7W8ABG9_9ACTN|nr:hypothetical protein [Nonomuraea endophytica]MBB5083159.1 hypothetical protein [Nonomuraea endophytica]
MTYPIIEERALAPVPRRFLRTRRDLADLPETPPGSVLVFEVAAGYHAFTERRHLRGAEDEVVDAVSVSVVDVRTCSVIAQVPLPSADLAHDFPLRATFTCTVTHPEKIVEQGLKDIGEVLAHYLSADTELLSLGLRYPIEKIYQLRQHVVARVKAHVEVMPPEIDGMTVALARVDLLLPEDVRGHAIDLKTVRREGEVTELKQALENKDVARIEEILCRGTAAGMALGVSRGHVAIGDAVLHQSEAENRRAEYVLEMIKALPQGSLDFLPVNTRMLLEQFGRSVLGPDKATTIVEGAAPPVPPAPLVDGSAPRPLGLEDLDD